MIEAVVQTGSFETTYRRAGYGGAVLLLVGDAGAAGDWLFDQLAARFRTIAPLQPAGIEDGSYATFEPWLRGVIDGLGLQRPALVAGVADAAQLLRFAAVDPERVDRVALIIHSGNGRGRNPTLDHAAAAASHPLLLVRVPGPEDPDARAGALGRLVEFLGVPAAQAVTGSRSIS
jgi:pimeloyl-ACP methyl ester carboxylesterase